MAFSPLTHLPRTQELYAPWTWEGLWIHQLIECARTDVCAFWNNVKKCHATSPGSLGTLDLWMSPSKHSCHTGRNPNHREREAMYRFSNQSSCWTQPSRHHTPETRPVSEGASRWASSQTWGTLSLWTPLSAQTSVGHAHVVCEHNKMVTDSCYLAIDEWSSPWLN